MKAYFVMRLLQKNTDFDHLMTSGQIAELLDSYDISAQEKSIQRDIPTEILIKLALFHKVSTDYILGIKNEK